MHFQTITKLLDFPNVIVIDALDCGDNNHHLIVKLSDKYGPPVCSGCGAVHTSVHSKGQLRVEDQPISGRRVFLYLEKRKCRCPEGGIYVELDHGCTDVSPGASPNRYTDLPRLPRTLSQVGSWGSMTRWCTGLIGQSSRRRLMTFWCHLRPRKL